MIRGAAVLVAIGSVTFLSAQTPAPSFEVASVRQNATADSRSMMAWPKGSLSATNMQLRLLIAHAYEVPLQLMRFIIVGGPDALLAARYDIQARTPDNAPEGQHFAMLRSLLIERFKLRVRSESRQTPVYALIVAREDRRLGPELRASTVDCDAARERARQTGQGFIAENAPRDAKGRPICWSASQFATPGVQTLVNAGPLTDLVRGIQAVVDRPVMDATALTGTFEWQLVFGFGATPNPDALSVFTAVQEQLGLKLEVRTAPFDVLVVDSVERPTPD